jgi:glycerophosphoryl diester phosphodiesterase
VVHAWTLDTPADMHAAEALGVDGIITNAPSVLACVLAK